MRTSRDGTAAVGFWQLVMVFGPPVAFVLPILAVWLIGGFENFQWINKPITFLQAIATLGAMCFPCGTFLQARRKWNQARAHESQSWPTAPGEVERSVKKTRVTGLPMKLFALELTYSYRVSGYTHQGNSVQFGAKYVAAEGLIEAQAQKYPAGSAVTVHYDPNDPATSVLETSNEMARQNSFQIWLYFLSPPVISAVVAMKNAVP